MNSTKKIALILLGTIGLIATRASAVPLTFAANGVGSYEPASAANNDIQVTAAANALITWHNGGANPNGGAITYTLINGTAVPDGAIPTPATFGAKDENAPFDSVSSVTSDYVLGKYGNVAYLFYIGALPDGTYELPSVIGGNELSHEVSFAAATTVPDGGVTMALLGCTLLCLEGVRRKFRRN
jgi:hypothetical protein